MLNRVRNRQRGFTLIELLIVVAIIGIIAALLIPNFLDALQKAKQKRTVADARNTGTAMMSWLTDQVGAAAAGASYNLASINGGSTIGYSDISTVLSPQYMQMVPEKDGWKNEFTYYLDTANPLAKHVMGIASGGRDKTLDQAQGVPLAFDPTDYDQDIIWMDGYFVRWPQKLTS